MATILDAYRRLLVEAGNLSRNRDFSLLGGARLSLWRQVRRDRALAKRLVQGQSAIQNQETVGDKVWLTVREAGRVLSRYSFDRDQFRFWQKWRRGRRDG